MTSTIDEQAPAPSGVEAPRRPDGSLYRYEMLWAGDTQRAYADTAEALLNVLIPGYMDMTEQSRWEHRLAYAARAQVLVQAMLNTTDAFATLPSDAERVLQGPRFEPPVVATWPHPVPLVLISAYYAPATKVPAPVSEQGMPPNVIWINTSDDQAFLDSLHDIGVITLHEALT